jgi:hypothetical protein
MNQDIEKALKEALIRKEPRPGFADRVMARIPEAGAAGGSNLRTMTAIGARPPKPVSHRPKWLAIGLAASLAVGSFAGLRYQQYRQGQEASRQLILALQITGEKLTLAQHKVVGVSERRADQ